MAKSDIIIRVGGEGGEGVISTGDLFTIGAARTGFHVFTFRTYPAEIRGGHAWYQIRVSNRPVLSIGDGIDVLVAFDAEAYETHVDQVNPGGVLIYDPDRVRPQANGGIVQYGVPFQKIAREELDFLRGKNVVVTGVLAGLLGLDPAAVEEHLSVRFKRRAELLDRNREALRYGYEYTNRIAKEDPYYLGSSDNVRRLVMSGNDAIVAGALHAGCRYFAGYPITPASDILEAMARELPKLDGVALQAEDEMAAIGSAVGASFAGVKAMTATSGPGFSLMTEILGLASITETPLVVVDAQRAGPSTGMPTKLEQGDLFHALYGGHGDFPRIVLAPGSVEDCLRQTVRAFNMAERYQCPVIFLSDQSLSHRTESLTPSLEGLEVESRLTISGDGHADFQRYRETESGVSPAAIPGRHTTTFVAASLEHDEYGHPDLAPATHERMTQKRFHKLAAAEREQGSVPRLGDKRAELGIISWGATEGAIIEAMNRAREKGYKVAAMHPRVLSPLAREPLREFLSSVRRVLVPEVNYQGQFAHHLAATFGIQPLRLNKYGGLPFTPGEILARIEEVYPDGG